MSEFRRDTTVETVVAIVEDLTQDWGLSLDAPIDGDTKLAADLEFASVDIIQLCVALEQCYGQRFGFQDPLMKDGSYVGDLPLSAFAQFIDAKLSKEGATA